MLFITIPVILYQLFFVFVLCAGGLLFGRKVLFVLAGLSLLWTGTHLFFVPLAVFQTMVIIGATVAVNKLISLREKKKPRPWVGQASYKKVDPGEDPNWVKSKTQDPGIQHGRSDSGSAVPTPQPPEETPRTGQ